MEEGLPDAKRHFPFSNYPSLDPRPRPQNVLDLPSQAGVAAAFLAAPSFFLVPIFLHTLIFSLGRTSKHEQNWVSNRKSAAGKLKSRRKKRKWANLGRGGTRVIKEDSQKRCLVVKTSCQKYHRQKWVFIHEGLCCLFHKILKKQTKNKIVFVSRIVIATNTKWYWAGEWILWQRHLYLVAPLGQRVKAHQQGLSQLVRAWKFSSGTKSTCSVFMGWVPRAEERKNNSSSKIEKKGDSIPKQRQWECRQKTFISQKANQSTRHLAAYPFFVLIGC